jgi:hypothetical protein
MTGKRSKLGVPLSFARKPSAKLADDSLTFDELKMWAKLKKKIKHGPRLSRKRRAAYVIKQAKRAGLSA